MSNLNPFGEWVVELNEMFGINLNRLAELSGIDPTTLSRATRGDGRLSRKRVHLLWDVFKDLAHPYPLTLAWTVEEGFFNAAEHVTDGQKAASLERLEGFRTWSRMVKRVREQQELIETLEKRIQELENKERS